MAEPADDVVVELYDGDDEEQEEEPLSYDDAAPNLCEPLSKHPEGERALRDLAEHALETHKYDWEEQEEYRQRQADDWNFFTGKIPDKKWPFAGAANVHVPIFQENVSRLHARLMKEVFGNWDGVFAATPFGPNGKQVADLVSIHTNYQLCHQILGFRREMDRAMLMYLVNGDVFAHSYYDAERGENYHEVLSSDCFVIPFTMTTTRSDLSDVPRKSKILYRYDFEIRAKEGVWHGVEKILDVGAESIENDPVPVQRLSEARGKGIEPADDDEAGRPFKLLQWEGWTDKLPLQDAPRYVQMIVDFGTRELLFLAIHETEDPADRQRYEREARELKVYEAGQKMNDQLAAEQRSQILATIPEDLDEEQLAGIDERIREGLPPAAPPPPWLDPRDEFPAPRPAKMVPVQRFVHAVNMENLSGALGIGTGAQQAHHNKAANTLTNQFIDQATLNNVPWLVKSSLIQLSESKLGTPGMIMNAEGADPADIQAGIKEIRPGPGNPQLIESVDKVVDRARSSMQSPEVLSGESGKSGETWRGIAARIEQATTQLSTIGIKFAHEFLTPIARNNAELNRLFLPEWELQMVLDHASNQMMQTPISHQLYAVPFLWYIRADMRFSTKAQRIGEADELLALAMSNPYLAQNPALVHAVLVDVFTARDRKDLIPLLGQPPQAPPQFMPPPPPPGPGEAQQGPQ